MCTLGSACVSKRWLLSAPKLCKYCFSCSLSLCVHSRACISLLPLPSKIILLRSILIRGNGDKVTNDANEMYVEPVEGVLNPNPILLWKDGRVLLDTCLHPK